MLTTILDRLTTLTSKYFIVGAFIPVLIFAFVNGAILYKEFDWFSRWAQPQISGTARAFDAAAILVGLAALAYVQWSLSGFLRQVLEGAHLTHDSWLARHLRAREFERRRALRSAYYQARDSTADIGTQKAVWQETLTRAAVEGQKTQQNQYDTTTNPAALAIKELRQLRSRAIPPKPKSLASTVSALEEALRGNSITHPPGTENSLARDRLELLKLFDYAREEWEVREIALANQLQVRFGAAAVAPTSFGNIAESMQSYALTRYRMNLPTFWPRLQPVLQKHSESYGVLQDVKLQLDFLLACVWLAGLTTAIWVIVLPIWGNEVGLFLAVATAGPLVMWLCYRAAVENYVVFGEVVRTSIDLYRLELLHALNMPRPSGLREERSAWDALERVAAFGQEWLDVSYRRERDAVK